MLFITNRTPKEGGDYKPSEDGPRPVTFDLNVNEPSASVFFCRRVKKNSYEEIGSSAFLEELRIAAEDQILLYIHGFNNQPEPDIFPNTKNLQALCNGEKSKMVKVIPLIWPCDNDLGVLKDYWDDQDTADQSAFGFARMLGKFLEWRSKQKDTEACYKRINILAHSMGNRVLRLTLERWGRNFGAVPQLFRNIFLVAADIVNESLESDQSGHYICESARNVVVYHAGDDLALRTSKAANVKNKVVSKRLGHSGPEDMRRTPVNVYAIDCDEFNNTYNPPAGHTYFMYNNEKKPGAVFKHMFLSMKTGRVHSDPSSRRLILPRNYAVPNNFLAKLIAASNP